MPIQSPLLNYLSKNNFSRKKFKSNTYCNIDIPEKFSFIENPELTLEKLSVLVNAVYNPDIKDLHLNHKECKVLDLGASTVMDVIIMEARNEWKRRRKKSPLNGKYSRDKKVNEILKVVGLHKDIGHQDSLQLPAEIKKNYSTFNLRIGQKEIINKPGQSTYREKVATELTIYFDDILKKHKVQLTGSGINKLSQLLTEILDNTEQHSSTNHWYVNGYRDENGTCNICIFNFGESIHKTLSTAVLDIKTKTHIIDLINKHMNQGYFRTSEWSAESLWTLYALQEGVSRFNTDQSIREDTIRGLGTTMLIDFFMQLSSKDGDSLPKMAILSGNTYILFDEIYKLEKKAFQGGSRKIIAFNKENDLNQKPDNKNVKTLKNHFPGTIISLKFKLDDNFLKEFVERQNGTRRI